MSWTTALFEFCFIQILRYTRIGCQPSQPTIYDSQSVTWLIAIQPRNPTHASAPRLRSRIYSLVIPTSIFIDTTNP